MYPHHQSLEEAQQHMQQQQQSGDQQQHLHHHHHLPQHVQRLRVTMPTVSQQQQQSSLNTPLPQSGGSPTSGINWILPSPDRTFYAPLFGILTPNSQAQQISFSPDVQGSAGVIAQFGASPTEFSFDHCTSLLDDSFRTQQQQQQQQQVQQPNQQQQKYHPWPSSSDFDQGEQELVIPKQEPFTEFCSGGPHSVEGSSQEPQSSTSVASSSVGLAEYNPSTSKGHEILSQVRNDFF